MKTFRQLLVLVLIFFGFVISKNYVYSTPQDPQDVVEDIQLEGNPRTVVINPLTDQAIVSSSGLNGISIIDLSTGKITSTIPLKKQPFGLAIDLALNLALVTHKAQHHLVVIDLNTHQTQAEISVGKNPCNVAVYESNSGPHLGLTVDHGTKTVSVINLQTFKVVKTIPVGKGPRDIAVDPKLKLALVAQEDEDNVSIIDLNTYQVTGQIPVGRNPRAINLNPETHLAAVVNGKDNFITVIDLINRHTLSIPVDKDPSDLTINPLDNRALVVCNKAQSLHLIDLDSNLTVRKYPLSKQTRGVAVNPFTNMAGIVDDKTDSLTLIQLPNPLPEITSLNPPRFPRGTPTAKLVIEGSGFIKSSRVTFQPTLTPNPPITFLDNYHLEVDLPPSILSQAGTWQITVNNPAPDGGPSASKKIYVDNPVPVITTLNPATATAGGPGMSLTILGSKFFPDTTILVNNQTRPPTYASNIELQVNLGTADLVTGGPLGITASNPGPGGGLSNQMKVMVLNPIPTLSSLSPNSVKAGTTGVTLTLNGAGFRPTATVQLYNTLIPSTWINSSRIEVPIPTSLIRQAGSFPVVVINPSPGGGQSGSIPLIVTAGSNIQPLPNGSFGKLYEDLVPPDATISSYDPKRFSLITGLVKDSSGNPLAGVTIGIHSHPEYGTAQTDNTGRFSLPVEGGGSITITSQKSGFIPAHRQVNVGWNSIVTTETLILIPEEKAAMAIIFDGNPATILTHRSTPTSDAFGTRALTMVLTGDNLAYVKDVQGNEQSLTNITVRATEYPTPESMPAKLPPMSAFTYCAELSVDNAKNVRFKRPVVIYVDNFLGFKVGEIVPVGYYDRDQAVWVPADNGVVVRLLDTKVKGIVDAYTTDGQNQYPAPGLTDSTLYKPGDTYWRIEHTHFTPWDYNWPWGFPNDAIQPNSNQSPVVDQQCPYDDQRCINSYVEERSRILHEDLPIPGTDLTLHYASNRTKGYKSVVTIPASGTSLPTSLKRIIVKMEVAGRTFETTLPPHPNQKVEYVWDGLDYLGRQVFGSTKAEINIGFVYQGVYYPARKDFMQSFGQAGANVTGWLDTRQEVVSWKQTLVKIDRGGDYTLSDGWAVSAHHYLNPSDPYALYKGDGTTLKIKIPVITTFAGWGWPGDGGDGGLAIQAILNHPKGVAADKEGNIYIADSDNNRVRKVNQNGYISTFAGNGQSGYSGDGGPATQASLNVPTGLALDSAGNLFIIDSRNYRIRKVDPQGNITTVAGNGQPGYSGDGVPATQASLDTPYAYGLGIDNAGNLYVADSGNGRIRKVDLTGIISTFAGTGQYGYSGDGGLATQANLHSPYSLAVDNAGNVYIADAGASRIRKVDPSGIITTIAGNGQWWYNGDGIPAVQAALSHPRGLTVDSSGNIYISDFFNDRIRKVNTGGIITTYAGYGDYFWLGDGGPANQGGLKSPYGLAADSAGNLYIADSDNNRIRKVSHQDVFKSTDGTGDLTFPDENGQAYIMDSTGLHNSTIDLATGKMLLTLGYDSTNKLTSLTDRFGNQTTIHRDGSGAATSITSPDGLVTRLTSNGHNHLTAVSYPDNSAYAFTYTSDVLMTEKTDPKGNRFNYQFDGNGLITGVFDPEGGAWNYSRSVDNTGTATVTLQTAEGNNTTYQDRTDSTGAYSTIKTDPSGSISTFTRSSDDLTETNQPSCGMNQIRKYDLDPIHQYKYLKELSQGSPAGLTQTTTDNKAYLDTNGDARPDLINRTLTINGKIWSSVNNTLTGTLTRTSPSGRSVTLTYDPVNLLTRDSAVTGLFSTGYSYDTRGRLKSSTTGSRTSALTYDSQGNIATIVTADGKTLRYTYDALGRLKTQTLPDGSTIQYNYDANGNLTVLANPKKVTYGFDYTKVNLRQTMAMPLSGSYQYNYDKERNLKSITFPSGRQIVNNYAGGLLRTTTSPEGATNFTYNCSSLLGEVTRGSDKITYGYDGSLLTSDTRTGLLNQVIGYGYNNDFRLISLNYSGSSQALTYDNDGLMTSAGSFIITRNPQNGLPVSVSDGNLTNTRTFNGYSEIDGNSYFVGGSGKYSYTLTRDLAGRITQKIENVGNITDTYNYAYDPNGRLTSVQKNGAPVETYTYDPNGNRSAETNSLRNVNRSYTVSVEDQVITAGLESYQFDADGFLISKTSGTNISTYQYSSRGEIQSVTLPGGTKITYDYDPMGRRIAKRVGGAVTEKYLWKDALTLLAVYDGHDNPIMRFTYADGRMPVSMTYNQSTYYLAYDQIDSLRTVTDITGKTVKKIDYDSFGSILSDTDQTMNIPFGFAGGLHDRDANLIRFGARDYDPTLGRWTAKDPIDFAGGDTNLYGYVLNDPVNSTDPLGLTDQAAIIGQYVSGALARGGLGVPPSPWEIPNWIVPPYGRWGGPGRSGPGEPIDSLDKCFQGHDRDYEISGIREWNKVNSTTLQVRKKCDRELTNCISKLSFSPLNWDNPPPWRMPIQYAMMYRIGSQILFWLMSR